MLRRITAGTFCDVAKIAFVTKGEGGTLVYLAGGGRIFLDDVEAQDIAALIIDAQGREPDVQQTMMEVLNALKAKTLSIPTPQPPPTPFASNGFDFKHPKPTGNGAATPDQAADFLQ